ncbi:MAG: aminopeptidase P family protein [Tissierellia bacterium]|nr:aminopeptidase P family protein [Tissierellia bacterium]
MNVNDRIKALRELMSENNIDIYVVATADYHNSEYVGEHFKERVFITGFTGSAGTAIITKDKAGLWTDGRYFLQAEKELAPSEVKLYKMGEENVPTVFEFIKEELKEGETLGFDGRTITYGDGIEYEKIVKNKNGSIIYDLDLIDKIWKDRPALSTNKAFMLDIKQSGESAEDKIRRVREEMKKENCDLHIITSIDDCGWLLNLRGDDVEFFPLLLSYITITKDKVDFYVDKNKFDQNILNRLNELNVSIHPYNDIYEDIKNYHNKNVMIDSQRLNYALYKNISDDCLIVDKRNPTVLMKAIKNKVELENIHKAHIKDGIAHTKFIYWLKKAVKDGKIEQIDELKASDKLVEFRKEQGDYISASFAPICGFAENGAIVHYESSKETNKTLKEGNLFLTDTGANYIEGSTDITRTTALGEISQQMKEDYTMVLKCNLNLQRAKFLKGCTGVNLDILARSPIWKEEKNYNHGTGHGVGYLGNIHEGPAGIRWQRRKGEDEILQEGMIITNEPGFYYENNYGIRLENEMLVREGNKNEYGTFMHFDVLTFVPWDKDAIYVSLLSKEDIEDLNNYHKLVYDTIADSLTEEERKWLKEATARI